VGFPIRTSTDHSFVAAPRSLSQLSTSFIATACQGIHRAPLLACLLAWLAQTHSPHKQTPLVARFTSVYFTIQLTTTTSKNSRSRPGIRPPSSPCTLTDTPLFRLTAPTQPRRRQPYHYINTSLNTLPAPYNDPDYVELRGFEPRTPCLQSRCSSQLSYSPSQTPRPHKPTKLPVGLAGVEPATSRLSGVRSNHLSYKPSFPSASNRPK
jgi:hypothetical protein